MIQITPQTRIMVAVEPVDLRRGIDGLSRLVHDVLKDDSSSGCVFVFTNRTRTSLKVLVYDSPGQGFWLCQKRLSKGRFRFWPSQDGEAGRTLQAHELETLLRGDFGAGLDWRRVEMPVAV